MFLILIYCFYEFFMFSFVTKESILQFAVHAFSVAFYSYFLEYLASFSLRKITEDATNLVIAILLSHFAPGHRKEKAPVTFAV